MPADTEHGGIREGLEAAGRPIGPSNLLFAAHVGAAGVVLVTDSTDEYFSVRDLRVSEIFVVTKLKCRVASYLEMSLPTRRSDEPAPARSLHKGP